MIYQPTCSILEKKKNGNSKFVGSISLLSVCLYMYLPNVVWHRLSKHILVALNTHVSTEEFKITGLLDSVHRPDSNSDFSETGCFRPQLREDTCSVGSLRKS
jgi:hypothetical protein